MTQVSAPLVGDQLTDVNWRDLFGDEPGVVGDMNGSAYAISLAANSDVASIGSATQMSLARVAGFSHRIPTNDPEPVTIPAASGSARTDLIVARYDPAWTSAPGPVRLTRIAGSSSGLPAYDSSPPGIEDLPLWAVTRQPGQALSAATVLDLRTRIAPVLTVPVGAPLPTNSPLGTTVYQGTATYRRQLDSGGIPAWVAPTNDTPWTNLTPRAGTPVEVGGEGMQYTIRDGRCEVSFDLRSRSGWQFGYWFGTMPTGTRPSRTRRFPATYSNGVAAEVAIGSNGEMRVTPSSGAGDIYLHFNQDWAIG